MAQSPWLWSALEGGARVVSVSSAGHHNSPIRWDGIHFERGYDKWLAYGQSKTANALFAAHLDRLGREAGIRAFSLHPGKIFTPLQRHLSQAEMVDAGWLDADGSPADPTFKTPEQGRQQRYGPQHRPGLPNLAASIAKTATWPCEPKRPTNRSLASAPIVRR